MSGKKIDEALLAQAWVHSHEEDTPKTMVYRQAAYRFPPARGRKGFELQPGGTLILRKPGPTDQPVAAAGTWRLTGDQLELAPQGGGTQTLTIESVEPDRLAVQKKPSG